MKKLLLAAFLVVTTSQFATAQHRNGHIEADKKVAEANGWIYDNLEKAIKSAKIHNMPIMVVIRCPP